MASTSEIGFAKTLANLAEIISIFTDLGATYNPSNPSSAITNLQSILDNATQAQTEVNDRVAPDDLARNDRDTLFAPISKNLTTLRKAYKATEGITKNAMDDFDSIVRKYRGAKKDKKQTTPPDTNTIAPQKATHSAAHTSYVQRTNTIEELIALLNNTPNYNPNEAPFKITTWQALHTAMDTATKHINKTAAPLALARTKRNNIIQDAPGNLVDTANPARSYALSVVPAGSPVYKGIMRLQFRKQ